MKSPEKLLAKIKRHLAEQMKDHLVLEGDLLLRRKSGGGAAPAWLAEDSQKGLAREIEQALASLDGVRVEAIEVNERGIYADLCDAVTRERALLEIESSLQPPPCEEPNSAVFISPEALGARVIATMALPQAFAHKIAAALEREGVRDLYELALLEPLCSWDEAVLTERLAAVEVEAGRPRALTRQQAAERLAQKLASLDAAEVEGELAPLFSGEPPSDLLERIRASLDRILSRLV